MVNSLCISKKSKVSETCLIKKDENTYQKEKVK